MKKNTTLLFIVILCSVLAGYFLWKKQLGRTPSLTHSDLSNPSSIAPNGISTGSPSSQTASAPDRNENSPQSPNSDQNLSEEPEPVPTTPVKDRTSKIFPDSKVLAEKTYPVDASGNQIKVKLLHTDYKYPNIRVHETNRNGTLVQQEFMVADHLMLTLSSPDQYSNLGQKLTELGSSVLLRQSPTLVLVRIPNPDSPDSFEAFREKIKHFAGLKFAPDADFIRTLY